MLHTFKVRIYPNTAQQELFDANFDAVRYVWNWALRKRMNYYKGTGRFLSNYDLSTELKLLKTFESMAWLKPANSQALQMVLRNLDKAYEAFFDPSNPAKFPKFKKKFKSKKSFALPQHNSIDLDGGLLSISKAKHIKAVFSHKSAMQKALATGKIKTVTISMTSTGKYFASILIDDNCTANTIIPSAVEADTTLGIDLGISSLLTLSDGTKLDNPRHTKRYQEILAKEQRILARKQKGSNNHKRQKLRVAVVHEKIKNTRLDNLHKVSTELVSKNHATCFVLETLRVRNMVQNPKLAKHIADCGWSIFTTLMDYKAPRNGKTIVKVNQWYASSKLCHCCGYKNEKLTLEDRVWDCPECKTHHDRDLNAAINIKAEGLKHYADGTGTVLV